MGAELKIKISGDGSGWAQALNTAKQQAATFSSGLAGKVQSGFANGILGVLPGLQGKIAALFDPSAILEKLSQLQDRAKQVKLGSIRSQLSTDEFQKIDKTLQSVGLDASTAVNAIKHIASAQDDVKNGSLDGTKNTAKLVHAYAQLGVTLDDINNKTPQQLFKQIADSMKDVAESGKVTGEQMGAIVDIFGRGAMEMLPVWAKGFDSLAASLGNLDEDTIKKLGEIAKLKSLAGGIVETAVTDTLTGQSSVMNALANLPTALPFQVASGAMEWLKGLAGSTEEDPSMKPLRERANKQAKAKGEKQAAELSEKQKSAKDKTEADKEEEKVAEQRRKNLFAVSSPEEKRKMLLEEIAAEEKKIADFREAAEAGFYSQDEARLLIAKQNLEIDKQLGELAQIENRGGEQAQSKRAPSDADKFTRMGIFNRDSATALVPSGKDAATRHYQKTEQLLIAISTATNRSASADERTASAIA